MDKFLLLFEKSGKSQTVKKYSLSLSPRPVYIVFLSKWNN